MGINTISILPESIKKQRRIRREIVLILSIAVLISVILIICGIVALKYRLFIEDDLAFVSRKKEAVETAIQNNEKNIEVVRTLSNLREIIEREIGSVPDWENVLNQIPNELYIEEMEAGFEEESFIVIRGYSTSQYAVSHFADLLDNIESVSDNDIVYINKLPVEDGNFVQFEIKIYVLGTPYILKTAGEA